MAKSNFFHSTCGRKLQNKNLTSVLKSETEQLGKVNIKH